MHVEILVECSFTSEGLLRIICRCCGIAREQVRISGLDWDVDLAGLAGLLMSE